MVKSHRHPHLPHPYDKVLMKRTMWRSGFYGAVSGAIAGIITCLVIITPLILNELINPPPPRAMGGEPQYIISDGAFSLGGIVLIWLPALLSGGFIGFGVGILVPYYPIILRRWRLSIMIGSLSIGSFVAILSIVLQGSIGLNRGFLNIILFALTLGGIAGVIAYPVYGILQRRFLPELTIN